MSDEEMLYREMNPEDTFYMGDDEPNDDRPSDNEQEQNRKRPRARRKQRTKVALASCCVLLLLQRYVSFSLFYSIKVDWRRNYYRNIVFNHPY